MQLTDRRIFFTWEYARRREGVPLYEDRESALEPSFPGNQSMTESFHEPWSQRGGHSLSLMLRLLAMCSLLTKSFLFLPRLPDPQAGISVGCIDFSLMPES